MCYSRHKVQTVHFIHRAVSDVSFPVKRNDGYISSANRWSSTSMAREQRDASRKVRRRQCRAVLTASSQSRPRRWYGFNPLDYQHPLVRFRPLRLLPPAAARATTARSRATLQRLLERGRVAIGSGEREYRFAIDMHGRVGRRWVCTGLRRRSGSQVISLPRGSIGDLDWRRHRF